MSRQARNMALAVACVAAAIAMITVIADKAGDDEVTTASVELSAGSEPDGGPELVTAGGDSATPSTRAGPEPLVVTAKQPSSTTSITGLGSSTETTTSESTTTTAGAATTTSMTTGQPESVVFAAIGDFGTDDAKEREVADLVASWNADFVVTVGDNRYSSHSMDQVIGGYYCDFLADVEGGNNCAGGDSPVNRFFPALGNHDYDDGGGVEEYLRYFDLPAAGVQSTNTSGTERYYDVVQGPVHIFAIDSEGSSVSAQKAWLETALGASTSRWKIVLLHHPPYSSSDHGSQSKTQWDYARWGADVVMAGHDHAYERIERDGILYFVNGLGGRQTYEIGDPVAGSKIQYNDDNGAMRITADQSRMTFEFVTHLGTIIDSHTIQ